MESALFLSSPFTNLASTPFTHTHDCLVNPPMSVYSSVPSSTWSPFLSLSLYFLSRLPLPSSSLFFSLPLPTFRIPVPSLPRTRRCDIRVSELWIDADKRPRSFHQAADYFPAYDKSEHSQIFAFVELFINLSFSFSLSHRSVITIFADTVEGRNWVRSALYLIFKYMIIKDGEKLINEPCAIIDEQSET